MSERFGQGSHPARLTCRRGLAQAGRSRRRLTRYRAPSDHRAMTTVYYEKDGDLSLLADEPIAVVGYGNQGRSWALNLRDSGCRVRVCVRADATRAQAEADGFTACLLYTSDAADERSSVDLGGR